MFGDFDRRGILAPDSTQRPMTELYNRTEFKSLRRKLRRTMPPAEKLLWPHLRNRRLANCKFRRQYGIDRYVIDFYASEIKLAIEIDGPTHDSPEARKYDAIRQAFIESTGATVLRFRNWRVYNDRENLLREIEETVDRLRQSISTTP
jgi:very-short-patch-repair endonuclease